MNMNKIVYIRPNSTKENDLQVKYFTISVYIKVNKITVFHKYNNIV